MRQSSPDSPFPSVLLVDLSADMRGAQKQVLYLAEALNGYAEQSAGPVPILVARQHTALAQAAAKVGINSFCLGGLSAVSCYADIWRLRRLLRSLGPCILHSQGHDSARLCAYMARTAHHLHIHTRRAATAVAPGRKGRLYREAHACVAPFAALGDALSQAGLERGARRIIPSCIDAAAWPAKTKSSTGRFIFAVSGSIISENGYETLIAALPLLYRQTDLPLWEIRITGSGPLFAPLLELAMTLGVKSSLALLGEQNTRDILPLCDALIAPATAMAVNGEDNGDAIREAWAVGLPVIASDLAVHAELVSQDENALIYPMNNPEALALSMGAVMRDAHLRGRLRDGGRAALERCTPAGMCEAYLDVYRGLLPHARR